MNWTYRSIPGAVWRHSVRLRAAGTINQKKLLEIANLEVDCRIGKARHLIAADRKNKWRIYLGLFAVIGSAVISSGIGQGVIKLGKTYFSSDQHYDVWVEALRHILPLLVGISTAIIGFLGLEKQTTQHRAVGNAYIELSRKARSILNTINAPSASLKKGLPARLRCEGWSCGQREHGVRPCWPSLGSSGNRTTGNT